MTGQPWDATSRARDAQTVPINEADQRRNLTDMGKTTKIKPRTEQALAKQDRGTRRTELLVASGLRLTVWSRGRDFHFGEGRCVSIGE